MRRCLLLAATVMLVCSGAARARSIDGERTPRRHAATTTRRYSETASSGVVQAQFSYSYNSKTIRFSDVTLKVRRGGEERLNVVVKPPPRNRYAQVWPANFRQGKSVTVRDLDGDGEPEVLLALYWGGAHCCYFSYVYRYLDGGYRRAYHLWGDPTYRLRDLNGDGEPEFVGADDRFAYAFTDFADSVFPLQIWRYDAGVFSNVTRTFPAQVRADAARMWRVYGEASRERRSVYGVLAAWAADQCLLDRCATAFRRLELLREAGKLRRGVGEEAPEGYLRHLRRFLASNGYIR